MKTYNNTKVVKIAMEYGCITVKDFAEFVKSHNDGFRVINNWFMKGETLFSLFSMLFSWIKNSLNSFLNKYFMFSFILYLYTLLTSTTLSQ